MEDLLIGTGFLIVAITTVGMEVLVHGLRQPLREVRKDGEDGKEAVKDYIADI